MPSLESRIIAGRGHLSGRAIAVEVSESGEIQRPYCDVISFGPVAVPVTNQAIYTPSANYVFVMHTMILSALAGQIFTLTIGGVDMTMYLGTGALGGTEMVAFGSGGFQLPRVPLLLTTANAVLTSVIIFGRQITV
jgi:hypothetical protein